MSTSSRSILVVEDDSAIRECLIEFLRIEGYKASSASNGKEALEFLHNSDNPCLILLDLTMPIMNGWEFLEKLQQMKTCPHIPVVITSAVADRTTMKGVAAILRKPYQHQSILQVICQFCGPPNLIK